VTTGVSSDATPAPVAERRSMMKNHSQNATAFLDHDVGQPREHRRDVHVAARTKSATITIGTAP